MESFLIESYAEGWSLAFYEPLGVMFHSPNCQSWVWKWIVTPHFGFDDLMGENQRIPEACPFVGGQQSRKRCWIGPSLKPDRHGWCRYPPAIKDNNIYIYNRHVPIYRWFIDDFSIETFKILDIPLLATHGLREDPDEEKGIAEETMSEAEASGPLGGCTRSYPLVNIQETLVNQCKSPFL